MSNVWLIDPTQENTKAEVDGALTCTVDTIASLKPYERLSTIAFFLPSPGCPGAHYTEVIITA